MRCFFHKWSEWGEQYESEYVMVSGSFGDTSRVDVVAQDRKCHRCGKVQVNRLRDGKLKEARNE